MVLEGRGLKHLRASNLEMETPTKLQTYPLLTKRTASASGCTRIILGGSQSLCCSRKSMTRLDLSLERHAHRGQTLLAIVAPTCCHAKSSRGRLSRSTILKECFSNWDTNRGWLEAPVTWPTSVMKKDYQTF